MTDTDQTPIQTIAEEIKATIEDAQERLQTVASTAINDGVKAIFNRYPFLEQITWAQYTPYFNDGDACYFELHEICFTSTQDIVDGWEPSYWEDGTHFAKCSSQNYWPLYNRDTNSYNPNPDFDQEYKDCKDDVTSLIHAIPSYMMKQIFGDHKGVSVSRQGIDVTDYDHD